MIEFDLQQIHIRVFIAGVQIFTTSDVEITESLSQLTRTASFLMAAQPDPQPESGDDVVIDFIRINDDIYYPYFAGKINSLEVESEPWSYSVLAVDQLELLRATHKGSDLDFTGMTETEAWKAVADYCSIDYDDSDIDGSNYELGVRSEVAWHDDASTDGASVMQELDDVFGMHTMTIGYNRVIRFAVDYDPDNGISLYNEYEKGNEVTWVDHRRTYGDRDAIQNVWTVRGVTADSADGSCQSTPWATAVSGNAQIGRKRRTAAQSFGSDFIQDESLAEFIVRRQMRRFNRQPDKSTITLKTDPNFHAGAKIRLIDKTYGINTTDSGRYCYVDSVSKNGLTMSAELVCGPAGAEGTVTTGVDKVCGDNHSNPDWNQDWDPITDSYPPLTDSEPIDYTALVDEHPRIFVASDIPAEDGCLPPPAPEGCVTHDWSEWTPNAAFDWEITGKLTLNDNGEALALGMDTDDGFYRFRIAGGDYYDPLVGAFKYEFLSPNFSHRLPGYAVIGVEIDWILKWEVALKRLTFYADVGSDICYSDVILEPDATMTGASTWESVTGSPTRTDETIDYNCEISGGATVVGLIFANDTEDGSASLAIPMDTVFAALDVEL